jgi:hypothetical protein
MILPQVVFDDARQCFTTGSAETTQQLISGMVMPLSATFQLTREELEQLHDYLQTEKERNGWTPRITIADWTKIGPGHAILIEPDGRAIASPVWSEPECLEPFGNLYESSAAELWNRFPYKQNHLDKYLERTMIVL